MCQSHPTSESAQPVGERAARAASSSRWRSALGAVPVKPLGMLLALSLPLLNARSQAESEGLNVRRFSPAPGFDANFNHVEGSGVLGPWVPMFGTYAVYGYRPLVASRNGELIDLLQNHVENDLQAAIGLGRRFQLGVTLPLTVYQVNGGTEKSYEPAVEAQALGDLVVQPKARLLNQERLKLALAMPVTLPTGQEDRYQGEASFTFEPRAILEVQRERWRSAFNLGYLSRTSSRLFGITSSDELRVAGALAYSVLPDRFTLMGEVFGGVGMTYTDGLSLSSPGLELNLSGRYRLRPEHIVTVGAGPGIGNQFGTPTVRAFASYQYALLPRQKPLLADADHDTIPDAKDKCIDVPEDLDHFEDADGCVDPDNDQDGLLDAVDQCPLEPEDKDGVEDEEGCPDPDNDKDGVVDSADQCPDALEDQDNVLDTDGCPESDADGDGVADADDACPEAAEDPDRLRDDDGCPETDADGDGLADEQDLCPRKPEDATDPSQQEGCPATEAWVQARQAGAADPSPNRQAAAGTRHSEPAGNSGKSTRSGRSTAQVARASSARQAQLNDRSPAARSSARTAQDRGTHASKASSQQASAARQASPAGRQAAARSAQIPPLLAASSPGTQSERSGLQARGASASSASTHAAPEVLSAPDGQSRLSPPAGEFSALASLFGSNTAWGESGEQNPARGDAASADGQAGPEPTLALVSAAASTPAASADSTMPAVTPEVPESPEETPSGPIGRFFHKVGELMAFLEKNVPQAAKMGGAASMGIGAGTWLAKGGPRSVLQGLRKVRDLTRFSQSQSKSSQKSSKSDGKGRDLKGMSKQLDQLIKITDFLAEQTNIEALRDVSSAGKQAQRALKLNMELNDRVTQMRTLSKDMQKLIEALKPRTENAPEKEKEEVVVPPLPLRLNVGNERIELAEHIVFKAQGGELTDVEKPLVGLVVTALKNNRRITRLALEGYCDGEGDAQQSQTLSKARADAVQAALVAAGIEPQRLEVRGLGQIQPPASPKAPEEQAQNRRVAFVVLEIDGAVLPGLPNPVDAGAPVPPDPPEAKTPAT